MEAKTANVLQRSQDETMLIGLILDGQTNLFRQLASQYAERVLQLVSRMITSPEDAEEVTQDDEYLYFGDIGDNNGVRNDLHVLRLEKAALASGAIAFDTLWFSYPDRTDSSARDFDCEAFVATDTALILFTKQWLSQGGSCYSIPKTPGRWEARRLFDIATEGMVTGACYQPERGRLVLCGYNMFCMPFVYLFDGFSGVVGNRGWSSPTV